MLINNIGNKVSFGYKASVTIDPKGTAKVELKSNKGTSIECPDNQKEMRTENIQNKIEFIKEIGKAIKSTVRACCPSICALEEDDKSLSEIEIKVPGPVKNNTAAYIEGFKCQGNADLKDVTFDNKTLGKGLKGLPKALNYKINVVSTKGKEK